MTYTQIIELIHLAASIMTILGITGLLSWGFRNKDSKLSESIILMAVYSFKAFISLLLLIPISMIIWFIASMIIDFGVSGIIDLNSQKYYWNNEYPGLYSLVYLISGFFPMSIWLLLSSCILQGSREPLRIFKKHLFGNKVNGS